MLRYTIDWVKTSQKQMELERQKQMSELALLRSQINPHFLFNTLNNIYSLVYQKSEKAPQVVLKLSEIMRYMLYESNTEKVLLSKEIEYLKGFIEIQKLRLKNEDAIKFEIKGNIENVFIAPMLLIPFVENAFKHGDKGAENIINIKLSIENKTLVFEVINPVKNIEPIYKDNAHGIGLQNIQRRLNLIYPSTHLLEIKKQNDLFKVTLKIEKL
jgi:LytS/YehU family sensor histidine kinase